MKCLLDTHVILWTLSDPNQLSSKARRTIEQGSSLLYASSVSIWEMAIKTSLGKLQMPNDLLEQLKNLRINVLNMNAEHALKVGDLPPIHSDPFDRLLISQALSENMTLLTRDKKIASYDLRTIDA